MTPPPRAAVIRVGIVDDHPLVRLAIRQSITAPDIEVVAEAGSAEEALLVVPDARPDILLVDINLPGLDGIRLVRELAPRLPETQIIMLTVSGAERDVLEAIRNGARGYLTKDLAPEALVRSIRGAYAGQLAMERGMAARLVQGLLGPGSRGSPGDEAVGRLTKRERDVLGLLAEGLTDREIALTLTLSQRTVETHVSSILHKLGARNRAEAVRRYRPER